MTTFDTLIARFTEPVADLAAGDDQPAAVPAGGLTPTQFVELLKDATDYLAGFPNHVLPDGFADDLGRAWSHLDAALTAEPAAQATLVGLATPLLNSAWEASRELANH